MDITSDRPLVKPLLNADTVLLTRGFPGSGAIIASFLDLLPAKPELVPLPHSCAPGSGETTTRFLDTLPFAPHALEVVAPGMNTTIQDFPGRTGYWHIGVPPSGPMDSFAFRVANALVGNGEGAAALEVTLSGARLLRESHGYGTLGSTQPGPAICVANALSATVRARLLS